MSSKDALARQRWHDRLAGAEGAAFAVAALTLLQDAPVDVANYFSAEPQGMGLFSPHGVPHKTFHALAAFRHLTGLRRLSPKRDLPAGLTALAGVAADGRSAAVLLSRHAGAGGPVRLAAGAWAKVEVFGIDEKRNGERVGTTAEFDLPAAGVRLVRLTKE